MQFSIGISSRKQDHTNNKWGFPYLLSHSILWTLQGCYYWILFSLWRRTQTGGRGMAVSPTSAVVDVNVPKGSISKTVQTQTGVQWVILFLLYPSRPFNSSCQALYSHSINWQQQHCISNLWRFHSVPFDQHVGFATMSLATQSRLCKKL